MLEKLLGGSPAKVPAKYKEASPVSHVHKGAAPLLLLHGTADSVVPMEQSQLLARKLRQVGAKVTLLTFDNAPHDFDGLRDTNARLAAAAVEAFLLDTCSAGTRPALTGNDKLSGKGVQGAACCVAPGLRPPWHEGQRGCNA